MIVRKFWLPETGGMGFAGILKNRQVLHLIMVRNLAGIYWNKTYRVPGLFLRLRLGRYANMTKMLIGGIRY